MRSRLGVVLLVYGVHVALALAFAWPVAKLVADASLAHPRGDLILFEPGATYLMEAYRLQNASLTSIAEGAVFAVLVTSYLGLLPLAALMHALAHTGRVTFASLATVAGRFFGTFSLLLGLAIVAATLLGFVPQAAGNLVDDKLKLVFGDRNHDIALTIFKAISLGGIALVIVVHDLARAAAVSRELSAIRSVLLAAHVFRSSPWGALGAWGLRGIAGILLVIAGAWLSYRIGVETSLRFTLVTLLHQAIAFTLVFLRARWLASAVALVSRSGSVVSL